MSESEILKEKYRIQAALAEECGGSVTKYMEQAHQAVEEMAANEGIQLSYAKSEEFDQPTTSTNESSIGV